MSNIYIVLNKPVFYSETFIKAHIDGLEAKVIYTSSIPFTQSNEDYRNHDEKLFKTVYYFIQNQLRRVKAKKLFKNHKHKVVLREYLTNIEDITFRELLPDTVLEQIIAVNINLTFYIIISSVGLYALFYQHTVYTFRRTLRNPSPHFINALKGFPKFFLNEVRDI